MADSKIFPLCLAPPPPLAPSTGSTLSLLHGAGGTTQIWRGLFPLMVQKYHLIAVNLSSQAFSQSGARHRLGLAPMAEDLAGVTLALQLAKFSINQTKVIGINGAFSTYKGVARFMLPMMAKVLAATTSSQQNVKRLIENTGSPQAKGDLPFYQRLVKDRAHVDGTLTMMASTES
jgi:magnesium chelatase accessory protein